MGDLWLIRGVENNGHGGYEPLMAIVDDYVIAANIAEHQRPGFMVTVSALHVEIVNLSNPHIRIVAERITEGDFDV